MTQSLAARADQILREIRGDKPKRARCEEPAVRRTVNYNWTEAAVAAVLTGRKIYTREDLKTAIEEMMFENYELYISNLMYGSSGRNPADDKCVEEYLSNIKVLLDPLIEKTTEVSVPGSTRRCPNIKKLDEGLNKKQIKFDVIAWTYSEPIGFSVKKDRAAPLTNYAIEGGRNSHLLQIRMKMLEEAGFKKGWQNGVSPEEKKEIRGKMNQLFYDKNSIYWTEMETYIRANEQEILKTLIEGMTARGVHFPMYEIDGKNLTNLDVTYLRLTDPKNRVELKVIDNPCKNPGPSAALHVGLFVNGEKEYDGKVRFKGDLFSPPELLLKNKGYS